MPRRIYDPLKKSGVKLTVTSFATGEKILTDAKVKAAKMKITMASYLTACIIKGNPQIKTKKDTIHAICSEMGLDEELIQKMSEEQSQGTSLTKTTEEEGGES